MLAILSVTFQASLVTTWLLQGQIKFVKLKGTIDFVLIMSILTLSKISRKLPLKTRLVLHGQGHKMIVPIKQSFYFSCVTISFYFNKYKRTVLFFKSGKCHKKCTAWKNIQSTWPHFYPQSPRWRWLLIMSNRQVPFSRGQTNAVALNMQAVTSPPVWAKGSFGRGSPETLRKYRYLHTIQNSSKITVIK